MCIRDRYGTKPRIQLGDKFAEVNEIPLFLERHKTKVPESRHGQITSCLLYTSDAADERSSVDLGGRRIIKKKKTIDQSSTRVII